MLGRTRLIEQSCSNSLEIATHLLSDSSIHGLLYLADTHGKTYGRNGRIWEQFPGQLLLTYILKPAHDTQKLPELVMTLSLGLLAALRTCIPELSLEWPNDIVYRSKKVAGLICTGRWDKDRCTGIVVGIGINVNTEIPASHYLRESSISMGEAVLDFFWEEQVLESINNNLSQAYTTWLTEPAEVLQKQWLAEVEHTLSGKSQVFHTATGEEIQGIARAYHADGSITIFEPHTDKEHRLELAYPRRD